MRTPVIAIGLDAADPTLIEQWMAQGHLKTLSRLREQGAYTRINNIEHYRAETPWTTFLTGCLPDKTGYWSPVKFHEGTYIAQEVGAYDFKEYQPFYALGEDYRVAVFDMPQSTLAQNANGVQVLAWGAHSALTPSHSQPASIYEELIQKHGEHPAFGFDHASTRDVEGMKALKEKLEIGIARRSAICQDLLQREDWDFFLTIFGETHSAGHIFWHLSQPDHPLYAEIAPKVGNDLMLETFVAIDRAIGEMVAKAPENAQIVVFAAHGMGSNVMDLPSMLFLPELMYRWNFPGQYGLARGNTQAKPGKPFVNNTLDWLGEVWRLKYEANPIRQFLRKKAPVKLFKLIDKFFGTTPERDLVSPFQLVEEQEPMFFQPAMWYRDFWTQMKAFALPSYSEGYIRINLQGREPQGIVAPAEYDAVCEEICAMVRQLKDARTGQLMAKEVIRTRKSALDRDPKLPDADIVIIWQEEYATDTVDSPEFGRIGPVPHLRTGSHRAKGFFLAKGGNIAPNSTLPVGHALDLAPTLLTMMGAPIPEYFEGKSMVEPVAAPTSELVSA
ncbi:alkaline phosphatase family protein [Desertifilum sp. FACHB-1129]|uniref:Nucleotide pyrophosphatase n=1 Tax=Desertifilum tharense IPPAS B-1220 TaxID=1781255 RepID=A0A1E5QPK4_9CYAN|nr:MULTISPECIES: alkaline phosphatase family protein [Desertifilum]MDA0209796.1 alkaline phosphatase family protein [Cyanobacteria bacterium FC1]MBD2310713.1 alkaline phosphatase family protein [Desertifilum sp. FACHB-1129]MBD2320750.1 alkaline phosphatase family protein [Desertifilum sp. FACHB-866]MBD2330878.1 alkaline phosphatase family protein [Desertifilum sp. FACHB-868]OEJ76578.1 nucleotide pyrophosphatase [Desertifilum tharense IPPAS B-1220]